MDEDGIGGREDPEVFDDTEFYHQLLRDVIDARGNGTGGNGDWMAVQKEKRAKKKVDTKASKGRKLRSVTRVAVVSWLTLFSATRFTRRYRISWCRC